MLKNLNHTCLYCNDLATTVDHVPPKKFFLAGTENLITVPSCEPCNQKYSKLDEFAKILLSKAASSASPVSVHLNQTSIQRALERPTKFAYKIQKMIKQFDYYTENQIFTGKKGFFIELSDEDWMKIRNFLIRIVRGLYGHLRKSEEKKYYNMLYYIFDLESQDSKMLMNKNDFVSVLNANPFYNIVDGNVCKAKIVPIENNDSEHVWLLQFYNYKTFIILVKNQYL